MTSYFLFSDIHPNDNTDITLSGLYCWVDVFKRFGSGDYGTNISKDNLEKYDIVHVNYTPGHNNYLEAIRTQLGPSSSTKLVANVDYALSMWEGIDPFAMGKALSLVDHVFHVEPQGTKMLSRFLGIPVSCIPHPVDVDKLKDHRSYPGLPTTITCQYHRYCPTWSSYYYSLRSLPVRRVLCNIGSNVPKNIDLICYFSSVMQRIPYSQYIDKILAPATINIDLAPDITFGRGVVDAAVLKVPTICSNTIAASQLFPDLVVNPFDHLAVETLALRLINDIDFIDDCAERGARLAEQYNYQESYNRMVEMI